MPQPFQPSLCEPADIPSMRTLLRRHPAVASLQAELARRLAQHLTATATALTAEVPDAAALDPGALAKQIVPLLVQVEETGRERVAHVGACQLKVGLTPAGIPAGYWETRATAPTRALHEALNHAEWVVMLAPELRGWVQSWLIDEPWFDNLWPVERHELPCRLGVALAHALEAEGASLKTLLLLKLGYPVDFLQGYLRELGRGTPHPTLAEISHVLGNWQILGHWPRRARKMACLALPLRDAALIDNLEIDAVRSRLRALGLTRNAWARLHRLPLAPLRDLGLTLEGWQASGELPAFLQALSFLLSRLGPDIRLYQAWQSQAPEVLSDVASRVAAVRLGLRAPVPGERQQWYRLQRRSVSLRMLNGVVPGAPLEPALVAKTELFLTAVARHLLQPAPLPTLARRRDELSDLVDWFRACAATLPTQAFRGELPAMLRQSRHWHERLVAARELRERAQQLERLAQQAPANAPLRVQPRGQAPFLPARNLPVPDKGYWTVPLREHTWQDVRFLALRNEAELMEEAMAMRHCVDTYGAECMIGECHIISIRHGTRRLATLELRRGWGGRWEETQLKGPCNAHISDAFAVQGRLLRSGLAEFLKAFNAAAQSTG